MSPILFLTTYNQNLLRNVPLGCPLAADLRDLLTISFASESKSINLLINLLFLLIP
jgi:hypothetical protein